MKYYKKNLSEHVHSLFSVGAKQIWIKIDFPVKHLPFHRAASKMDVEQD